VFFFFDLTRYGSLQLADLEAETKLDFFESVWLKE
jgi:hypothetical protein